ncbi:MAG: low molecular weight phosphotyrosine protein phosphatase [Saprospiraceae bacterium]|nr:low molecular weight phosphotyrosine protein phosphatase [Saprospiraceae bacterium]
MKILMVCLGNICRSPLAEAITRKKIEDKLLPWEVDSVGTGNWHQGNPPDPRTIAEAANRGLDISDLRARQITIEDIHTADVIVAMDSQNFQDVRRIAGTQHDQKLNMMLNFSKPNENAAVPDPYFGGPEGFRQVFDLLDEACEAMINQLNKEI